MAAMTRLNTSVLKVNRTPARTNRPTTAVMIRVFIVSCSPLFRPGAAPLLRQRQRHQRPRKYRTPAGGRAGCAASAIPEGKIINRCIKCTVCSWLLMTLRSLSVLHLRQSHTYSVPAAQSLPSLLDYLQDKASYSHVPVRSSHHCKSTMHLLC